MLGEKKNYISDSGRDESTPCNKSANKNRKKKHQRTMGTDDSLAQFRGENGNILTGRDFGPQQRQKYPYRAP